MVHCAVTKTHKARAIIAATMPSAKCDLRPQSWLMFVGHANRLLAIMQTYFRHTHLYRLFSMVHYCGCLIETPDPTRGLFVRAWTQR